MVFNMAWLETFLPYILTPLTAIVGWLFGRKQRDNNFLQDLQSSINSLADHNNKLMQEILLVKKQNVDLEVTQRRLEIQNFELKQQIQDLNLQLEKLLLENKSLKKQKNEKNNPVNNTVVNNPNGL